MMLRFPNLQHAAGCKQVHAAPKVDAPSRAGGRRGSSRPGTVQISQASSSRFPSTSYEEDGDEQLQRHRVYIFDPESPEDVEESHLEPHPEWDTPYDLLAQQEVQEDAGSMPNGWELARQQAGEEQVAMRQREAKALEMQRALVEQLDLEQRQVLELQRYEGLYKEVMMRADRSEADVAYMQSMVAEKDAELAHTYKLLEASAQERSRLRSEHQAAQERMRDLQAQLIQAQAQLRTPKVQAMSSASPTPPPARGDGASGLDEAVEELTNLAYSLAMDMSEDIRALYPSHTSIPASQSPGDPASPFADPGGLPAQPQGFDSAAQQGSWLDSESPGPGFAHSRQW